MSKSKDGESIITQLESITNQDQSLWMAEKQPSTDVNKGDETNMSVRSKTKSKQSGVSSISTARKAAILSKKFEAEKAALRLKLLEEESVQCQEEENELQILQQKQRLQEKEQKRLQADLEKAKVQAERRKKWRELQQQARESQLEYEHAVNEEECMREEENRSMRQGLVELLGSETLEDRVMRLGQDETRNDNQDNLLSGPEQPLDRQNTTHHSRDKWG
ncbi:Hypothetical predicted protein [Paramuricea clavata]|uniref:Uncharacterized protein n=1 Tax=Paramuricea clavata TaxID=317549 RepID=A0A7D9M596_PARCT|nr:Hypothetical predicted protein [Paramuricea clavata]